MNLFYELILTGGMAFVLSIIIIPILKKLAFVVGLLDRPNNRKLHGGSVPLVGGIAILVSTFLALLLSSTFMSSANELVVILGGGLILLVTGSIDDKIDVKPGYKLIIQLGCAYAIASSGIRITSFYGFFGIYEIGVFTQYLFTLIIIAGVINAFNLMDGVDGLAGGLALVGFTIFSVLSFMMSEPVYFILFITLLGATVGFLKHNLSKEKVFLGDGGSLFLGYILVVAGISFIEKSSSYAMSNQPVILISVISIFILPVLDSLRVYFGRIKKGISPFKADRSHIHHLVLMLNISHRQTSLFIISLGLIFLVLFLTLINFFSLTIVLVFGVVFFFWFIRFLNLNRELNEWSSKLKSIEKQ